MKTFKIKLLIGIFRSSLSISANIFLSIKCVIWALSEFMFKT